MPEQLSLCKTLLGFLVVGYVQYICFGTVGLNMLLCYVNCDELTCNFNNELLKSTFNKFSNKGDFFTEILKDANNSGLQSFRQKPYYTICLVKNLKQFQIAIKKINKKAV